MSSAGYSGFAFGFFLVSVFLGIVGTWAHIPEALATAGILFGASLCMAVTASLVRR